MMTINELVDLVMRRRRQDARQAVTTLSKPQGVRGRNSDNTRLREVLGWEPSVARGRLGRRPTVDRGGARRGGTDLGRE